jgi:hypothetical protein
VPGACPRACASHFWSCALQILLLLFTSPLDLNIFYFFLLFSFLLISGSPPMMTPLIPTCHRPPHPSATSSNGPPCCATPLPLLGLFLVVESDLPDHRVRRMSVRDGTQVRTDRSGVGGGCQPDHPVDDPIAEWG